MARKPWESLTPRYRARLERKGVTKASHESGAPLYAARGHNPQRDSYRRRVDNFVRGYVNEYGGALRNNGYDPNDPRRALLAMSISEGDRAMSEQKELERMYHTGHTESSHNMWVTLRPSMPDYLLFYHGWWQ